MNTTKCAVIGCLRLARWTPVIVVPLVRPFGAAPICISGEPICKECADDRQWIGHYLKRERFEQIKAKAHAQGMRFAGIHEVKIKLYAYPAWKADQSGHMTILDITEPEIEVIERPAVPATGAKQ